MVEGWDTFRNYLADFPDSYVIIGGTAMQHALDSAPTNPRTTKDIDMVLVVDVLEVKFIKAFWEMIKDGEYFSHQYVEGEKKKYWRFKGPKANGFPKEIEIFSGKIDLSFALLGETKFTPVPADGDVPSLSAILMDQDYYEYLQVNHTMRDDVKLANNQALICLKVKAWLDLRERKKKGEEIDQKKISKHKNDVFRLAALLLPNNKIEVPAGIKVDLTTFLNEVASELPDQVVYKEMGMGNIQSSKVLELFKGVFGIE